MKRLCAFCSNEAVEKGGEHLWDDWINRELPETKYKARKQYTLDSPMIQYDTDSLNEKLPVVCNDCNSGWMSVLTSKVKERFGRTMLSGEPFSLAARDAAILASFIFMKGAVTNQLAVHEYEPFFTRAAREKFRKSLTLPRNLKLWFAAFQGEARISTRSSFGIVSTGRAPLQGIEFGSFTYVVGKLALQLLAPRWKDIQDRHKPLVSLTPNAYWDQATVLFWPFGGGILSWPPKKYIGDDMIQEFIQRFSNPVNLRNFV